MAQLDIARAEAALGGATAFLLDELDRSWSTVLAGDAVPVVQRGRVRLACWHAAAEATRAVDLAYRLGGGSSVFTSHPLQRCFRDIHTANQHIYFSTDTGRRCITYRRDEQAPNFLI